MAYRCLAAFPLPRVPDGWAPVFLIGCGRSGTTITGEVLARHGDILVLNEPRHIWRAVLAATDIWYNRGDGGCGKLVLEAGDIDEAGVRKARRMFYSRLWLSGRQLLVEKLPINSFRFSFLRRVFPRCRFLHIIRHGLEVANSIANTGGRWYGANQQFKWNELAKVAARQGFSDAFLEKCVTPVERGLVEWTLSVTAGQAIKDEVAADEYLEFRYDRLLECPERTIGSILRFLGVNEDPSVVHFSRQVLCRRNNSAHELSIPSHVCPQTTDLMRRLEFA